MAGERAQLVNYLLYKYEDPSLTFSAHVKKINKKEEEYGNEDLYFYHWVPSNRRMPRDCWLAILTELVQ